MHVSVQGRTFTEGFEDKRNVCYVDAVGVATGGIGHTAAAGPPIPVVGQVWSDALIDSTFANDLANHYEPAILRNVKVPLKQNEFDALTDFVFNVGEGNLKTSTLLAKLNKDDRQGAADELPKWNKARGKVLAGLTRRRWCEKRLFLTANYSTVFETPDLPTPANPQVGTIAVLRRGQAQPAAAVKTLQSDLAKLGYYSGELDGDFGPKTDAAVRAFQRNNALDADGIVGFKTSVMLDRVLRQQGLANL